MLPTEHSVFMLTQLQQENFEALVEKVEALVESCAELNWRAIGPEWGIDPKALDILDRARPAAPYPYYFCFPQLLIDHPSLIKYYRNIAMISPEAMRDIALSTSVYEAGTVPPSEVAERLACLFNRIISTLLMRAGVPSDGHLAMGYANLGTSLDKAWYKESGRPTHNEHF